MRNIILLFFLSITSGMAAAQSRTDSLYSLLDEAIANSDRYVEKREGYIRHTRGMYANAGMAARYSLALELYKGIQCLYERFGSRVARTCRDNSPQTWRRGGREPLPGA